MAAAADLLDIELTNDERSMLIQALNEYLGPANGAPLLTPLLGLRDRQAFYALLNRLMAAIETNAPLSDVDWARALLLTEISWGSALLGAGLDFATSIPDERAAPMMRSIQRKIATYKRFELIVENSKLESA
jgi:hypothetical protein